mgnify:FL=1
MIKKKDLSQDDKKVWDEFVRNPSGIYDKDRDKLHPKKTRFKFDLHGFTLENANLKVKELINYCISNNYRELLLITGKGLHSTNEADEYVSKDLGKLKYSVPEYIKNSELFSYIISIEDADKKDGGEGGLIIKLKKL